uniref:Translation initiation factor eIF2B subunit gamma n=1 Tax=Amorphochlora amoebiformis TaxID=1561963 RepID=A0A7S0H794_9EUKA|mmetsp:Transcript_35003/g.56502  ORF Transcript_35003/g.56502 Transcript_35003/m.56502 type:complete len:460 (+) Transcript_35003:40-1419(+)
MSTQTRIKPEFQAILLAGGAGNRMYPLPEKTAKCLLPVCNRPLITYQLRMLENTGLKECIVVVTEHTAQQVSSFLNEKFECKIRCIIHKVDDYTGTADALRQIADRIITDFIVVSADVITDCKLLVVADTHRSNDAVATLLFSKVKGSGVDVKDKKSSKNPAKKKQEAAYQPECNFIGLEQDSGRVLVYTAKADVEDSLSVSKRLLQSHPRMTLHSQLDDAHIYIFSHWVIKVILQDKSISSIQNELIPYLVKAQFRCPEDLKEEKSKAVWSRVDKNFAQGEALGMSSVPPKSIDSLLCMSYVPDPSKFSFRVNTVPAYKHANREVVNLHDSEGKPIVESGYVLPEEAKATGKKGKAAFNVGKDCVIGDGVQIGVKTNIKKSVVGSYCKIGEKCRISNCVLMDHVTIEKQVTLSDTVVCSNAHIQAMSSLDNCEVGANYTVPGKTKSKKEQFSTSNFME